MVVPRESTRCKAYGVTVVLVFIEKLL
jgi:hypothetical protein